MNNIRSVLFLLLLFTGLVGVAHGGRDDTATNPRDFNGYYAPAYQLPDPALMTPAMAKGKELSNSHPFDPRFVQDWTGVGPDGMRIPRPPWVRLP